MAALALALAALLLLGRDGDEPPRRAGPATPDERSDRRSGERPGRADPRRGSRAPRGLEIALQDNAVFLERNYYDRALAFRQARELGVSWMRTNLLWSRVERSPRGRYDWSQYDDLVAAAGASGIRVELALTGPAPPWATGNGREGGHRPDARRFGAFARAAAEHFRGRVRRYSIWNEPNFVSWLEPQSDAATLYRRLYEAGWAAVKGVDPGAQVLIGETAAYAKPPNARAPLEFLRELACAGRDYRPARRCRPLRADGYAHHPYHFTSPPESTYPGEDNVTIGTLGRLTRALDRLATAGLLTTPQGRPLDVYLTEFGYFASGDRALPAAQRAEYLPRAFAIAARRYPRVRQMLHYLLVTPPRSYPGGNFNTGIVSQSGDPHQSFAALAAWARDGRRRGRVLPPLRVGDRPRSVGVR